MKRIAFLVIAVFSMLLVACSCGGITGTYKIDTSAFQGFDKLPQAQKDQLTKGTVTLNADKSVVSVDAEGKEEKGTWELKDKTLTINSGGKTMNAEVQPDGRLKTNIMGMDIYFKK